jgi:putative restriction endonuclease
LANVVFDNIEVGKTFSRNDLINLWGYGGVEAIQRGVITPASSNVIILFVTKDKRKDATQYHDYISDGYLYWDGEKAGSNNNRIINTRFTNHPIHLFYRYEARLDFVYMGLVKYKEHISMEKEPWKFIYKITNGEEEELSKVAEPYTPYENKETERQIMSLARIGQGKFRVDLLNMWDACSLTDVRVPEILKASHIKPWKESDNTERLDPYNGLILTPTLDSLFDRGFVSFQNSGQIMIAQEIEPYSKILNITPDMKLRKHFDANNKYLEYHRDEVYLKGFKYQG